MLGRRGKWMEWLDRRGEWIERWIRERSGLTVGQKKELDGVVGWKGE